MTTVTPSHTDLQEQWVEQCGVTLQCFYEFEEAEIGSRENGFQMEPDYPATVTLHHVYCGKDDILELLSEDTVSEIEDEILEGISDDA